ncbi:MAG: DinB family protein [Candidatus Rokubacteria bacterium]|nr:DinB family protein [Candidatus Rokubacteria bacterium]
MTPVAAGPVDRTRLVASLRATPTLLRAVAAAPADLAWRTPQPGEWSIGDVVRHLVEGDRDTFLPRLRRMIAEERPVFARGRRVEGDSADLDTLLGAFASARGEAVKILAALDGAGWRREGTSPSQGALSVLAYAATMADHDTQHLRQIHDLRTLFGLLPRRCDARLALGVPELLAELATTERRIEEVAAGLGAEHARHRPGPGEWSLKEVMAHLMDLERGLFLPRLRRMVDEDTPVFEAFSPDAWAARRDWRAGFFAEDLAAFRAARSETLAFLAALPPGAAERPGLSGHFGPVTLAQYATHVADHDLEHLAQMRACRELVAAR